VLPFTDGEWSFDDAAVDTITIDPHKFGQAAVPAGGLIARDDAALDALAIDTPYLETRSQATLTGTRSGAGVAGAVAAIEALWPDGYRDAVERATANAEWLAAALGERGYDVVEPELPLVAAAPLKLSSTHYERLAGRSRGRVAASCASSVCRT